MMKCITLWLMLCSMGPLMVSAQEQGNTLADFIACFDQQYGTNNLLVNGRLYIPNNPQANGHPYFQTNEWQPGIVFIKGQAHPAERLKLNLEKNQLIMKQTLANSTTVKFIMSDQLIDSFLIDRHLFVNQSLVLQSLTQGGYVEKIFADRIAFFRKQGKDFDAIYSSSRPYGQFINTQNNYYLQLENAIHKISRQKDFLRYFPNQQQAIKKYLKEQKFKWKKADKHQFYNLLKFCNDLL